MAIKRNSNKVAYGIKHYIFDKEDDLITDRRKLSTTYPGSTAFIIDTSNTYMLNGSYEWIKIKSNNSSNSGGSTTPDSGNGGNGNDDDLTIWDGGDIV